jgi:uncharacterized membrane protein
MLALAAAGLGVAAYLTIVHYSGGAPVCAISHGCETVQHSRYAKLAGVPVAVIGLAGYVLVLALLLARDGAATRLALAGATMVGFGFSAYLSYLELFKIHAICQWCVGSAAIMTALLALAVARAAREPDGECMTEPPNGNPLRGASAGPPAHPGLARGSGGRGGG